MKVGGLDVGRRFDKTTYLELTGNSITDIVQAGSIRFKEQAVYLFPRLRSCELILVDVTGVGQGLYECLEDLKLPVIPVTIVAGDRMRVLNGKIVVGKQFMVQNISTNISQLTTSGLPNAVRKAFRRELASFIVKIGKSCNKFKARTGHDDMVIALGLSLLGVLIGDRQDQAADERRSASYNRQKGERRGAEAG